MLPLLVLLGTIAGAWYLLIVRPQHQQQTRHGALVSQLQIGNHVLTVGGIYGRVVGISGTMVDVELSGPGSVTRIATDAIARIVPGSPTMPEPNATADARPPVTTMQQHPNDHTAPPAPQPAASGFVAPPLPNFAQPIYAAQPVYAAAPVQQHAAPQQYAQPMVPQHAGPQQPVPAYGQTTLRAHVAEAAPLPPAPILTPWADVAPRREMTAPTHGGALAHAVAPPVSPGFQLAHQQVAAQHAPQHAPAHAPQYAPQHAPSQPQGVVAAYPPPHVGAAQVAIPAPHFAPQPQSQPQPHHQQHAPAPQQPVMYQAQPPAQPAPVAMSQHEQQPVADGRRRSKAPEGMGSSLRLDDPSLQDTMVRARNERAGLADEYRRFVAPLVDTSTGPEPHAQYAAQAPHAMQPGQAPAPPNALFAHGPAQPSGAMPRPNVAAPSEQVDPALFQRRTPMAHQAGPQEFPFAEAPAPVAGAGIPA